MFWEFIIAKIIRLSSVTDYERALVTAQYLSFTNDNGIDPRLFERGYTDEQIKLMRQSMGDNSVIGGRFKFKNDLKEYRHPDFNFLYSIYDAWHTHHALPFRGSYSEQPNKVIDHFHTLDMLRFETEQKARADAEKEMRQKQRPISNKRK